jgi:predicted GTPase
MRPYPPVLAGKLYPKGIPTIPETQLEQYVRDNKIQLVVLAYSDVSYPEVRRRHMAIACLQIGLVYFAIALDRTGFKARLFVLSTVQYSLYLYILDKA